jgi:kynurenine formamidase
MRRIVDLTLTIENGNLAYEVNPKCFFNQYQTIENDGYNLTQIILNSHASTHMDAPYHFVEDGMKLDEIPLDRLIGPAVVINCTHRKDREMIMLEDIKSSFGKIEKDKIVLIRTDWYKHYPSKHFNYDMPNIDIPLIEFLVERKIKLLGLETPSLNWADNPGAHRKLLGAGIILVEALGYLDQLTRDEVEFFAIPLKLKGLDGCPIRAFAIE